MGKPTKTVEEKLKTKLSKLREDSNIKVTSKQVKVGKRVLFRYSLKEIAYTKVRYFPSLKEDIKDEDFTAVILLDHPTLKLLSGNICNPPRGVGKVIEMVRHLKPSINKIVVGSEENKVKGNTVYVTDDLYSTLVSINKEEGVDKVTRVRNRVAPFLKESYALEGEEATTERDYSLLLQEIIATKKFSQKDIVELTSDLEGGEYNEIVIEKQINKQAEWLLSSIQTIIDVPELPKAKAQELGNKFFNFSKISISGSEDLMEKILTKYGQNIIFGAPALLNIDKYVVSSTGLPKSQFDILLITPLSDIEIVELKRPDEYLLEYDTGRGKFYMCKTLAIATAQSERYISALYRENDSEFKIDGKTIREFIQAQVGNTITLSICRPKALIVIGTIQRLARPYQSLSVADKAKVTKKDYDKNLETAYKEMKASFKNIDITTYSELLEGARLRLQLAKSE
jgi:hypothetical protein